MNNEGVTRVMFLLLLFIALCNGWNLPQYPGDSNVPKYPNQIGQNNDQQFSTEPDNLPTPEDFIQAGLPDPSPNVERYLSSQHFRLYDPGHGRL